MTPSVCSSDGAAVQSDRPDATARARRLRSGVTDAFVTGILGDERDRPTLGDGMTRFDPVLARLDGIGPDGPGHGRAVTSLVAIQGALVCGAVLALRLLSM